jgi:CRP/FNR family transcriptional regulator, cyclic AMP receptor protein
MRTHQRISDRGARAVDEVSQMATEDARRLLGECLLFRELRAEERNALVARVQIRSYSAGETIFSMGSAGDHIMAVLSGSVRISGPSPRGKEILLAIMQPGEFFGEIALLDGKERTANARAITACHLAILEQRDVLALLDRHPKIWPKLVEVLCSRLRNADQHIAELALLQLPTRLAKALLRFARMERGAADGHQLLQVHLSQRELGNICGVGRESINKRLGLWQRRGIVQVEERLITVADRTALEELARLEGPPPSRPTSSRRPATRSLHMKCEGAGEDDRAI